MESFKSLLLLCNKYFEGHINYNVAVVMITIGAGMAVWKIINSNTKDRKISAEYTSEDILEKPGGYE